MTKKLKLFVIVILMAPVSVLYAQSDSLSVYRNINALQTYAAKNPVEKVHLHLDRTWYSPGDTIWFKAYVVIGQHHRLSALSGVLYVELIDQKDSVLQRETVQLFSGAGISQFILPFNYKSGSYRLRAYTNWMRNAGADYFCNEEIVVAGPIPQAVTTAATTKPAAKSNAIDSIDVQFFPEGGELVNEIRSKVAFKAVNHKGLSEDIKGVIADAEGREVVSFSTQHAGMGLFPLRPQTGEQYKAKIIAANGSTFSIDLPKANDKGLCLSINNSSRDSIEVRVAANDRAIKSKDYTTFYLVAQSAGKVYYAASCDGNNWPFLTEIPKSLFPTGILQFTLFSQSGEPIDERVIFIQNPDQLNIALVAQKQAYAPGEKVTISLDVKNGEGKPVAGTFSASVTDETRSPADEQLESNIFSDLLLKSELTGYIETPNYYFSNTDDKTRADLDLLMLTQGYRRFEWKQVLNSTPPPPIYQPEKLLSLTGSVKTLNGKPVPNANVSLASIKQRIVRDTLADANGNFRFDNLFITDTSKLYLRSGKKNLKIEIRQHEYPATTKLMGMDNLDNSTAMFAGLAKKHFVDTSQFTKSGIMLKQVNIKSFSNPFEKTQLTHSDNLNGAGQADQVIMGDQLVGCPNILNCLRFLLRSGVRWFADTVYSTHTPRSLQQKNGFSTTHPMAVMVDGVIMDQTTAFEVINPTDIYSIEVLESYSYIAIYGSAASGGLIVITTKRGDELKLPVTVAPGLTTYTFSGFYKARTFYSPKYELKNSVSPADERKTIYWAPNIITDAGGKAVLEYFNAGSPGTYRVVVEGIDDDGKLGRQVFRYKVQ